VVGYRRPTDPTGLTGCLRPRAATRPPAGAPGKLALALDGEPVLAAGIERLLGVATSRTSTGFTIVDRRPENIIISRRMKLYDELAEWWPVFSDPKEYRREAAHIARVLRKARNPAPRTVLELGSGGGNSAFHLKARFAMTLVDMSPQMLRVSRKLNPECEHVKGDIRTVRLGRTFDAVFVHDAICHMTTERDLRAVMQTAYEHCRPGGIALFVPDFVRETFVEGTDQGGSDSPRRRLRFLQWVFDPDPNDTTYLVDFAILLRNKNGEARLVHDRHVLGLFARSRWLHLLRDVGLKAVVVRDDDIREVFVGRRPLK
jgi:SAM-dependent methyltransferase